MGCSFMEVQHIWSDLQAQWAGAYREVMHAIVDAINNNDEHEARGQLSLERTIKLIFFLPNYTAPQASFGYRDKGALPEAHSTA